MAARFDHLVISVADLDEATARWTDAGLAATRGGAHPVGTHNSLVRGPQSAYLELIAAGSTESNPWLDRVRSTLGSISWAIAVDDVDAARAALVAVGFEPRPVTEGSRRTPEGDTVAWRLCDVGAGPYDDSLPFLIEWTTPMPAGPVDGPILDSVLLTPPDPERVADLLLALGFVADQTWPRRVFHEPGNDFGFRITLNPVGQPVQQEGATYWSLGGTEEGAEPGTTVWLGLPGQDSVDVRLDGVDVVATPDRRRFAATALLPGVEESFGSLRGELADWANPRPGGAQPLEEEYSRCLDPHRYRLLGVRAEAWIETVTAAGVGVARSVAPEEVRWAGEIHLHPTRATVIDGRAGTQPLVVAWAPVDGVEDSLVLVGVGDPTHVLERQPDCGCDACDTGSADLLNTVDDAFILALSGGVHAVRSGERVVIRSINGWSASGSFEPGEVEQWLADADAGRRTDGVVRGEPWL